MQQHRNGFNQKLLIFIHSANSSQIKRTLIDIHEKYVEKLKLIGMVNKQLQLLATISLDVKGSYKKIKRIYETKLRTISKCYVPIKTLKPS